MSSSGPEISTNGLTLLLDSANSKSYSGNGTTWSDISGNSNACTLVNSPTYSTENGGYFTFNGTNQYGTVANNPLNITNYTKSVWFYLTSTATNNNLISGWNGSGGHFMFFSGTNKLYCGHSDWGNYQAYGSTTTFSLNKWYHACLTFNTTDGFVLYVNGEQDSTYTALKTAATGGYVEIAAYASDNLLTGRIANASIYNTTLTSSQVRSNFAAHRGRFGI